jgi:hypothetical protein
MSLDGVPQRFNQIWQDVHDQLRTVVSRPQGKASKGTTTPSKPSKMTATNVTKQAKPFEVPLALMCYCVSSQVQDELSTPRPASTTVIDTMSYLG